MSQHPVFVACWFPVDPNSELRKLAYAFDALNIRQARAMAAMKFVEQFPDIDDAEYKLVVYQDAPGMSRPSFDAWDDEFLYEVEWDEENGHPLTAEAEKVDFDKLSKIMQISVLVKYDRTEIIKDQLPAALELTQDEASTFDGYVVEAINKTPEIANMHAEHIQHAIGWVGAKCAQTDKWPEIQKELLNWKKRRNGEHKPSGPSKSVVDIVREKSTEKRTAAAEDTERPKRTYAHTYQTLDQELANAFWPGDVNPGSVDGEIYRWAKKEVIGKDRDDWKRFSMALRTTDNILKYDLLTIRDVVQMRPTDIHKDAMGLNGYITNFLLTKGVYEDAAEQDTKSTTGVLEQPTDAPGAMAENGNDDATATRTLETAPQVRSGPFYWRDADGSTGRANKLEKLEELIAAGYIEISKEEHLQIKSGTKPDIKDDITHDQVSQELSAQRGGYVEGISDPEDTRCVDGGHVEAAPAISAPDTSFIARADELEKELGDSENLTLWRSVMRTNPRYTKDMGDLGFGGTSINSEYMIMRATEKFGPVGKGWGWKVVEDKMLEGAPLTEKIFEGNKFVGKRTLRDADGTLIYELNHSLKIEFWYLADGDRAAIESYGATVYRQTTKNGIQCDGEVHKKSLTDAIKKALSTLGFSADVWLGHYDDAAYKAETKLEFGIKDASEKADDSLRIREELDERFKNNVATLRNAISQNEVSKIASSLTRTIGIHLKAAKDINDTEYTKYLEGRLRRLEEVKTECLKNLEEKA